MNLSLEEMKQKLFDAVGEERIGLLIAIVKKSSYSPLDEAAAYIQEAIELAKRLNLEKKLAAAYREKYHIHYKQNKVEECLEALEKALHLCKKTDYQDTL